MLQFARKGKPGWQAGAMEVWALSIHILPKQARIRNTGYLLPNPFRSWEDFLKAKNLDLKDIGDLELWREEAKVKLAFANVDPQKQLTVTTGPAEFVSAQDWLLGRLAAISGERKRRSGRGCL